VVSRAARSQLEARKLELYDAIRTLDRDRGEGTIDVESYRRARSRFELEAAAILERLDHLIDPSPVLVRRNSQRRLAIIATAGVILLAVALFLGGALRARTGNAAITGDIGQATPAPVSPLSTQVLTAKSLVQSHPRDPNAELQLATAYIDAKDSRAANAAYQRAIRLAPRRPEARTMYAMFQGSGGDVRHALTNLSRVELDQPSYAKAWLVDGLLSSRLTSGLPRAIRAWRQFLVLSPHATVAPQVQVLLASALKVETRRR
jgi:cytochrome c-type biogenesis protein CcmH/NrfG